MKRRERHTVQPQAISAFPHNGLYDSHLNSHACIYPPSSRSVDAPLYKKKKEKKKEK